jgi:anti-sigma factor RsiW
MQCEHAQEFLSEYVTGDMDRALAVSLENHLAACGSCSDAVAGLRSVWRTLDDAPVVEPPPAFHAALMQRIGEEQARSESAARLSRRAPVWRSLLQPRALAYAATVLVLLAGAEIVQVQRASLGPVGVLFSLLHPTAALRTQNVEWVPNGQGGGVLEVALQANAQANGATTRRHVHVRLLRQSGGPVPGAANASADGDLTSGQVLTLSMPLDITPSATTDTLSVTLSPTDGAQDSETVSIPVGPSP